MSSSGFDADASSLSTSREQDMSEASNKHGDASEQTSSTGQVATTMHGIGAPAQQESNLFKTRGNDTARESGPSSPPRKRSRSDSLKRNQNSSSTSVALPTNLPIRTRETPIDQILLEQYVNRQFTYDALMACTNPHEEIVRQKRAERDFYISLHQERQMNPGAIFGPGYEGFGNVRTDLGAHPPRLLYPQHRRRPGNRKSKEIRLSKEEMLAQSEQVEDLVPIRLEIDWDKIKLRDTFTWNLHDRVTSPEVFAEKLVEDLGLQTDLCKPLIRQITQSIEEQLIDFYPQVFMMDEAPLDTHLPFTAYKNEEMRILIKLSITIGQNTLVDQFEWDINDPLNSPEEFAINMTNDLALPGEFTTAIAHSIREQIHLFTRSLYITSHPFDGRPIEDPDLKASFQPSPLPSSFRPYQSAKDFTPYLYELNEAELERTETNISREQRRQKRSTNRRGGPALPDLKDRQRTIRTLIVSSVIPGAAQNIEESRLFKRSGTKRGRRAAQKDFGESEEESDSDLSSAGSPALSHLVSQNATTSTRRSMRGAASAAQAKLHSLVTRSATPDTVVSVAHHETRGRKRDYREESSVPDAPERYIVTLKVNKDRLKKFLQNYKSNRTGAGNNSSSSRLVGGSTPSLTQSPMGPPQSLSSQTSAAKKPQSALADAVEAPYPPQPGVPPPQPPAWLVEAVEKLKKEHPRDAIEVVMRYSAVDLETGVPTMNPATVPNGHKVKWYYIPRIRCLDCIGKLYTPGPMHTLDNFEVHIRMKSHREKVDARWAKESNKQRS
ncbi:SWI/SNF chromatin-remodeling complex subunit [Ascosphaera aggregata]|nr:SWI/SNF chromatin-remodeling complex subunit [Ascosphaera aggregata]